jgi:hypothetical protein
MDDLAWIAAVAARGLVVIARDKKLPNEASPWCGTGLVWKSSSPS